MEDCTKTKIVKFLKNNDFFSHFHYYNILIVKNIKEKIGFTKMIYKYSIHGQNFEFFVWIFLNINIYFYYLKTTDLLIIL